QVVAPSRVGHVLERGGERLGPRKRVALRLGEKGDLVAREPALRQPEVEHVAVDFPARADDAARRHVEPRGAAPDLDLLAIGKPVALLPQRVVQHDAHVLQLATRCLLLAGALQYTSSSNWSALTRRGGSASPSPKAPRKNRKPWAWAL